MIVDNCTEKASRSLEEIKKKNPKKDLCQFENIAFTKCLSKEITINCPDWTKSSECESLMIFIKTCPFYNSLKFNGPGNSRGKNNKGEKKGGKENEEEMEEKTGDKKDQDEEKEE